MKVLAGDAGSPATQQHEHRMLTATGNGLRDAIIEARERAHVPDLVGPRAVAVEQDAGHRGWPRRENRLGERVAEPVRRITTPARQHDGSYRCPHQPDERGYFSRDVDDEHRRRGVLDPLGDHGHPVTQAAVSQRRPVQLAVCGWLQLPGFAVVARERKPSAGPARRSGKR